MQFEAPVYALSKRVVQDGSALPSPDEMVDLMKVAPEPLNLLALGMVRAVVMREAVSIVGYIDRTSELGRAGYLRGALRAVVIQASTEPDAQVAAAQQDQIAELFEYSSAGHIGHRSAELPPLFRFPLVRNAVALHGYYETKISQTRREIKQLRTPIDWGHTNSSRAVRQSMIEDCKVRGREYQDLAKRAKGYIPR